MHWRTIQVYPDDDEKPICISKVVEERWAECVRPGGVLGDDIVNPVPPGKGWGIS